MNIAIIKRNATRSAWLVYNGRETGTGRLNILNFCTSRKQARTWCDANGIAYAS